MSLAKDEKESHTERKQIGDMWKRDVTKESTKRERWMVQRKEEKRKDGGGRKEGRVKGRGRKKQKPTKARKMENGRKGKISKGKIY